MTPVRTVAVLLTGAALALLALQEAWIVPWIVTGNHGATVLRDGLPFLLSAWGVLACAAVLARWPLSRACFLTWTGSASIALGVAAATGAVAWPTAVGLIGILALDALLVSRPPRAAS